MAHLHGTVQLVWALAAAEAKALGNRDIEPEHLLLGLLETVALRDVETVLQENLELLREDLDGARTELQDVTQRLDAVCASSAAARDSLRALMSKGLGQGQPFSGHRSPACQRVFDRSTNLAEQQQQDQGITLCHLLQAILERSSSVLDDLFLSLQSSREKWRRAFESQQGSPQPSLPKDRRLDLRNTLSGVIPPSSLFRSEALALLMIDLVESTKAAYERAQARGVERGDKLLAKSHRLLHELFDRHASKRNVFYVEKPGDAVFAAFRSPVDCGLVACQLLSDLEKIRPKMVEKDLPGLNARLALHFAHVLVAIDKPQLFGLPVHLTARLQVLTAESATDQLAGELPVTNRLLLTVEMYRALPAAWQAHVRLIGQFRLKGFGDDAVPVYALDWRNIVQAGLAG